MSNKSRQRSGPPTRNVPKPTDVVQQGQVQVMFDPSTTPVIYSNCMAVAFSQTDVTLDFAQANPTMPAEAYTRVRIILSHQHLVTTVHQLRYLLRVVEKLYGGGVPLFSAHSTEETQQIMNDVQSDMTEVMMRELAERQAAVTENINKLHASMASAGAKQASDGSGSDAQGVGD